MIDRTIKPQTNDEITFQLPHIEKFQLSNGMHILFVRKTTLPILRFNLIFNTGSRFDPVNKKGMINLYSMMLDEGAGIYNALQLNEEFDIIGSNFDIVANNDSIFISLRTLKENTDRSLELFSEIIKRPHFSPDSFAREQRKVLTRLLQLNDDPDEIANMVFEYNVFGGSNPYAFPVIGFPKHVSNVLNSDLKDFYYSYFTPSNATMIIVGDTTRNEIEEKLNNYLGEWNNIGASFSMNGKVSLKDNRIYVVHKEGAVQSEIRVGHLSGRRDNSDFFDKTILNTILGGQFTSRINLNLREDKGYTYGAFSRFNYYKDDSYFFVSTSVNAENTGNALREIFNELTRIRDGVTKEELEFAKLSLIRKFPSNFETNRQIAANISTLVIHSLSDDYFDQYLDNINAIKMDDVNRAAHDNIFPDDSLIVIVGDKHKIQDQIKQFNREIVDTEMPGN